MLKEKKEKSITIRISEDLFAALSKMADMYGMSVSEYIRTLLDSHLHRV